MVWLVVLPFSFSSRLMRVTAAPSPMATAKMGSIAREMMYVGGAILLFGVARRQLARKGRVKSDSVPSVDLQPRPEESEIGALEGRRELLASLQDRTGHKTAGPI